MLKLALIAFSASLGLGTVAFFAGPVMTYSGLQPQLPFGTAIKVTPDGSNVWSWTETITQDGTYEVLVDFDKNGRMDSENKCFRVLVTDMQATFHQGEGRHFLKAGDGVYLEATNGWTWSLGERVKPLALSNANDLFDSSFSLATPLVVPTGEKLRVKVSGLYNDTNRIMVTLVGRVVNL
ncbi:MAG: hypothetical protein R3F30_11690 [Planctomycetota bacterium]